MPKVYFLSTDFTWKGGGRDLKRNSQLHYFTKGGNSIRWMSKVQNTVKSIPSSTNGCIRQSISYVFSGEFLWCCRSLYYKGSSPFLTLATELNQSGSSWPMNRMAEETYERERPIRLLYEGITQSATLQSISKSQGSWRIVYRSSHLWRLALKQKIKGKYLKHCTFATNVPKCTKISISFHVKITLRWKLDLFTTKRGTVNSVCKVSHFSDNKRDFLLGSFSSK